MQPSSTVFSQITSALFPAEFARCVEQFPTTRPTRGLTCYDQFLALCFGQLTYRESLRDVVACLKARGSGLYHLGFRGYLSRTNLAYAGRHRDWRLFQALAQILMRRAARLYQDHPIDPELPRVAFALDSSIISLSLNLFPWGYYVRSRQSALKLHLMLSLQGNLPAWGAITEAGFPDMKILDRIPVLHGAYYVMDRGYLDFIRLYRLHQAGGFFVVRNKHHVKFRALASRPVDKTEGLRCDQTIRLISPWSRKSYPIPLRRIRVYDAENQATLVLLTNQFNVPAAVIAELYRQRWQIELFFKALKQNLKIKTFVGTSRNALYIQIWTALIAMLLIKYLQFKSKFHWSLSNLVAFLRWNLFTYRDLWEWIDRPFDVHPFQQGPVQYPLWAPGLGQHSRIMAT
jgi:hypothetical protein